MKHKMAIVLTVLFWAAMFQATAQEPDRYVFVISKINYLKAIDDAVTKSDSVGLGISEVRVILCGESVKAFKENHPLIKKALAQKKVQIFACGLSLDQMKIDPRVLPADVHLVDNGLLEAMTLERQGYRIFDF